MTTYLSRERAADIYHGLFISTSSCITLFIQSTWPSGWVRTELLTSDIDPAPLLAHTEFCCLHRLAGISCSVGIYDWFTILCGSTDASLANKYTIGLASLCGLVLNISFFFLDPVWLGVSSENLMFSWCSYLLSLFSLFLGKKMLGTEPKIRCTC